VKRALSATWIALLLAGTVTACDPQGEVPSGSARSAAALTTNGVNATMTVDSWGGGYCASIVLANTSASAVTSWTLGIALNGSTVTNAWGGATSVSAGQLTIRPVDYNANIAPNASATLGFCGSGGSQPALTSFEVVGGGGSGPTTQTLTVSKGGQGLGTVASTPAGIDCGSACSASFPTGAVVTLAAAPASGSSFTGWSGACTGTGACTVTMSAAQSVMASFGAGTLVFPLTVTKAGTGSGTVTGAGIDCGSTCSASFTSGAVVTLSASPASGSTFTGWSGACSGTGACAVTMSAAQSVVASFATAVDPGTTLSINAGGAAAGAFIADASFSGGSTYATTNSIDTSQIVGTVPPQAVFQTERYGEFTYTIANRTPGSAQTVTLYFSESYWTAAGQRTFNVAINGATVLTAFDIFAAAGGANRAIARTFNTTASTSGQVVIAFTKGGGPDNPKICGVSVAGGSTTTFPLTVTKAGNGTGTVSGSGISCGSACSASYASGTSVTLSAAAASGSTFAGWSGACSGTSSCTVSMTAAQSVTATFTSQVTTYALSVTKSGSGSGTVTSNPSGVNCGSNCTASYQSGTTVTLSAAPASGSTFGGWSGACTGTGSCVASMTAARAVTATFNGSSTGGLVGWATVGGTVTGGGNASPVTVTTLSALNSAAAGTTPAVIRVSGTITGAVSIGSNKTIEGANASATIRGSIRMKGSANVILRNLNVVGYNCTDASSCESGADAIAVDTGAHHLWFDHLAVSDGSDGNLDFTHAADNITVSWCKFFYTGRSGGHQFSNLIGHSDNNASEDTGKLRITFHHNWWANGVGERMPRVRFGQVHVYNNLYTASGNNYCVAAGKGASVLLENNAFIGVSDPIDLTYGDGAATLRGNLFTSVSGNTSGRGTAFTPPYAYTLDAASSVEAAVRAGAGPR
jgi:pectate lyase